MRKILLIAVVAIMANTVMAQSFTKKELMQAKGRTNNVQVAQRQVTDAKQSKKAVAISKKADRSLPKKMDANSINVKDLKPFAMRNFYAAPSKAAGVQPEYTGYGTVTGNGTSPWTMLTGTLTTGGDCFVDVIPNPYPTQLTDGIAVQYTQSGNTITIAPQVAFASSTYYVFICSYLNDDIILEVGEDGSLDLATDGDMLYYMAFPTDTYDVTWGTALGYIEYAEHVKYLLPGVTAAPTVEYQPTGLYLHAHMGPTGYAYTVADIAMVPAYSKVSLKNLTTDPADSFSWSINNYDETAPQTSDAVDFTFETGFDVYTPAQLTGTYDGKTSSPYVWGTAKGNKTDAIVYAGDYQYSHEYSDGTYATMTLCNPDHDIAYSSAFATPDKNTSRSINTIVLYQGKPDAPLYFEGISYLVSKFSILDNKNFNLKCKIQKVTMSDSGWLTLGDVIAEADLDPSNVTEGYTGSSYTFTQLYWDNFYTLDDIGLGVSLDYIFIEDEFAIVIEGWDNGTFSCEHTWVEYQSNANAKSSTFYFATGDEIIDDNMYRISGKNRQFVGFEGAVYGFIHTEDDTNVVLAKEGGKASIHVEPMFTADNLWIDDEDAWPLWLNIDVENESYTSDDWSFDIVFSADALPEGTESREAELTFVQPGAKLVVTVAQNENGTGITSVKNNAVNGKAYDLNGRQAKSGQKGLIVRDGKKFIVK